MSDIIAAMPLWALLACGIGAVVAIVNVRTTRRLWASQMFERPQKIAQTVLLWIVPGSFVLVRSVLGERFGGRLLDASDPTSFMTSHEHDVDDMGFDGGHHSADAVGHGGGDAGGGD